MLHEDRPLPKIEVARLISPADIKDQIPFDKMEGVIVLGLFKDGEPNRIFSSSLTFQEFSFLVSQLNAHLNYILTGTDGHPPLREGY